METGRVRSETGASPVKPPVLTACGGGFRRATAHSRPTPQGAQPTSTGLTSSLAALTCKRVPIGRTADINCSPAHGDL